MLNLSSPLCTYTSTSQNASHIVIEGVVKDVSLDGYDKETLSILEYLQCQLNIVKSQSQSPSSVSTEQCSLSCSFGVRYGI